MKARVYLACLLWQSFANDVVANDPEISLEQALLTLARSERVQLILKPEDVKGKVAPAIELGGSFEDYLSRLLEGSGLSFRRSGKNIYLVFSDNAPFASNRDDASRREKSGPLFDEIVVVGSRRKDRTAADSNVPVDVLGGADLAASGQTETNMLLNSLL
ncbi:MAG: STN domain-containing protein, partial [Alphaproteobacteria bacterium]|nr:STN domain-containing protein [Alphaproteobacteria bacterium]